MRLSGPGRLKVRPEGEDQENGQTDQTLHQQFQEPESVIPDDLTGNGVRHQLFLNMANGTDQLRQRILFALSQIIVVSSNKTGSADELTP